MLVPPPLHSTKGLKRSSGKHKGEPRSILTARFLIAIAPCVPSLATIFEQADTSRFLNWLWKDADPDVPILKQAKGEYAKLN
jgi:hypothetical protein